MNFHFVLVRFKLTEDTYETLITNLNQEEFSKEAIKGII